MFSSKDASNALALASNLPKDKEKRCCNCVKRWSAIGRCGRFACAGFEAPDQADSFNCSPTEFSAMNFSTISHATKRV
jgi:hypothetical protein